MAFSSLSLGRTIFWIFLKSYPSLEIIDSLLEIMSAFSRLNLGVTDLVGFFTYLKFSFSIVRCLKMFLRPGVSFLLDWLINDEFRLMADFLFFLSTEFGISVSNFEYFELLLALFECSSSYLNSAGEGTFFMVLGFLRSPETQFLSVL